MQLFIHVFQSLFTIIHSNTYLEKGQIFLLYFAPQFSVYTKFGIAPQNRSAAERVIDRIMDAVDPLKNFAEMGTPLSSIVDVGTDYRFLVSGNYMVFYRVQGNDVYIDRVLYGRSDYMSVLFKDLLREETTE